jgi:hypothetical protein
VGPRAGLDRCGKSRPQPEFDLRTVQPVASLYTDSATRTTLKIREILKNITYTNVVTRFVTTDHTRFMPTCRAIKPTIFG